MHDMSGRLNDFIASLEEASVAGEVESGANRLTQLIESCAESIAAETDAVRSTSLGEVATELSQAFDARNGPLERLIAAARMSLQNYGAILLHDAVCDDNVASMVNDAAYENIYHQVALCNRQEQEIQIERFMEDVARETHQRPEEMVEFLGNMFLAFQGGDPAFVDQNIHQFILEVLKPCEHLASDTAMGKDRGDKYK